MKKIICFTLNIIFFSLLLIDSNGCSINKKIIFKNNSEEIIFLNSSMEIEIISNSPIKKNIEFSLDKDSIIDFEQIDNAKIRIKALNVGTAKITARRSNEKADFTVTVVPNYFTYGEGTINDPYLIFSKYQLLQMQEINNEYEDKQFKLMNDIIFNDYEWQKTIYEIQYSNYSYVPLRNGFKGVFDGNYKTINLNKSRANAFIGVNLGEIKKLKVVGHLVALKDETTTLSEKGLISSINFGIINNCIAEGTLYNEVETNAHGGVTGLNSGWIKDCVAIVNIEVSSQWSNRRIGGIAGYMDVTSREAKIQNCIFSGAIIFSISCSNVGIGAIVGQRENENQIISDCYYDINCIDGRTKNQTTNYAYPNVAIGLNQFADNPLTHKNLKNVNGVSNWLTIDFSSWDSTIWCFNIATPSLIGF